MNGSIIAIGGDGSVKEEQYLLDMYILSQSVENPKVCFLPTASGDNGDYISHFMRHWRKNYNCNPSFLSLFHPHTADIEGFLMDQDIIYVGGGNTKSMLGLWKEWELPKYLRAACENGTLLSGVSAGAVCWFQQCITDSIPGSFRVMDCLGFLEGSFSPHYNSQEQRRPAFHKALKSGSIKGGWACDEAVGLHFKDGKLFRAISSSFDGGFAYQLVPGNNSSEENQIKPELIYEMENINSVLKTQLI